MPDLPTQGEFGGIKTSLDRKSCVSVFIIHGVGGFPDDDPDFLMLTIQNRLNLLKDGEECVREISGDHFETKKIYGYLRRQDYAGVGAPCDLRIYSLDWSPTTKHTKENFKCVDHKHIDQRMSLSGKLKDDIVINSLIDAALYVSNFKDEIQYPVAQSIRWIQEDAKDQPCHENIVIGFSLGTQILINTLDAMQGYHQKDPPDPHVKSAAKDFIRQISEVFIFSNVGPLFELTEMPARHEFHYDASKKCDAPPPSDTTSISCQLSCKDTAFGRFVLEKRSTCPDFQLVAFSDPNDPLSFILDEDSYPPGCPWGNAFINEEVRNVHWSLLGFVNPVDAHIGYSHNEEVIEMVIFGLNDGANANCCSCDRQEAKQQ